MPGLGLPDGVTALLFDLDGVLTPTAKVHNKAWKAMFDEYLECRDGPGFEPFTDADYNAYVDGRPRHDGVREFLRSRGIELPEGDHGDPPRCETVWGLGNRKQELIEEVLERDGVEPYPGTVQYLEAACQSGCRTACVTSSANGAKVLEAAGLREYMHELVDGNVARAEGLKGKPAPDTFLAGARRLGASPEQAAVFEDALSGVEAGRAGGFAVVVGVDRVGQREALLEHGADFVVDDLCELLSHDREDART